MKNTKFKKQKSQNGIALFMVISAIAVLAVLVTEITRSSQLGLRMAYNHSDNVKAFYLAKAALKLSLVRLNAYLQVKEFFNDPSRAAAKEMLGKSVLENIWSIPFIYPPAVPQDSTRILKESIEGFVKESKLGGSFVAQFTGESSKLNLNNLFIKKVPESSLAPKTSQTPQISGANRQLEKDVEVDFRPTIEQTINTLLDDKKLSDREFADVYKDLYAKDVVDAIMAYLFENSPAPALPGFRDLKPKKAPLYSLSELHLIPGFDDEIYNLIAPSFTVYSTPGVNINKISKSTLQGLIPELTPEDAADIIAKRDGPEGTPWSTEEEFWVTLSTTSAGNSVAKIKERFKSSNIRLITNEESFKLEVSANVGQSFRKLEAFIILDPSAQKSTAQQTQTPDLANPVVTNPNITGSNPAAGTKPKSIINLIYWRII